MAKISTPKPYGSIFDWYKILDVKNKQGEIRVEDAQEVLKSLSLKAYEGGYKIMIVWMADKMNIAASNKLLKLLEEPTEKTLFILITENEVFTWYPSLAEQGFGAAEKTRQPFDEEAGPRLVFADGTQSIYMSDLAGDGLTDLVRIRNGEVCYWPNLGYGRFGKKVTMDNAPWFDAPDQFDQKRIRLADIDGSGTVDILYLGRAQSLLYFFP